MIESEERSIEELMEAAEAAIIPEEEIDLLEEIQKLGKKQQDFMKELQSYQEKIVALDKQHEAIRKREETASKALIETHTLYVRQSKDQAELNKDNLEKGLNIALNFTSERLEEVQDTFLRKAASFEKTISLLEDRLQQKRFDWVVNFASTIAVFLILIFSAWLRH